MNGGLVPSSPDGYLALGATGISAINIFGGFLVAHRMLSLFRRPGDPPEHNSIYLAPAVAGIASYLMLADGYGFKLILKKSSTITIKNKSKLYFGHFINKLIKPNRLQIILRTNDFLIVGYNAQF